MIGRRSIISVPVAMTLFALATVSWAAAGSGAAALVAPRTGSSNAPLAVSHAESQAEQACQADGATISTAISAFKAQNPNVVPTERLLQGKSLGGPYLNGWAYNPPYYTYSMSASGKLLVAVPTGEQPVAYRGPGNCEKLKSASFGRIQDVQACAADGAIISTALAAFRAQNPNVIPTKALLVGKSDGGPYLERWAYNPPYYAYGLSVNGKLTISLPAKSKEVFYKGPAQCEFIL